MAGMFVPRMVAPVDTSGLANLGQKIGEWRQESAIADVMKGLNPADPNSVAQVTQDLYARGDRASRDAADRLLGVFNTQREAEKNREVPRGTLALAQRKFGAEQAEKTREEAREERFGQQAAQFGRQNPIPSDEPGPPPPAPQRVSESVPAPETQADASSPPVPVQFGGPAGPVPGTGARVAGGMLATQPLAPLPPPPPRNIAGTGAAVPPRSPAAVPTPPPAVPAGASPAAAPLPPVPAPLRASTGSPAGPSAGPPGVDFSDLVSQRAPPVPPPTAPASAAELTRQIQALSAMQPRTTAQLKWQEREIKLRADELKNRTDRQNEVHKAAIEERKGRLGKDAEHAFKRADKIAEQSVKDNETAAAITQSQALIKEGVVTGQLSPTAKWTTNLADTASQIITKMGGDPDSYATLKKARDMGAAMTLFNGLAAKTLHGILGGFGQGITNVEGARLDSIVAGLPKDLAGNVRLLEYGQILVGSRRDAAAAVQSYMNQRYKAGAEPVASHIDEIQRRYADHAIARIEASAPKAAPTEVTTSRAAADKTPAARGGGGGRVPTSADEGALVEKGGVRYRIQGGIPIRIDAPPGGI